MTQTTLFELDAGCLKPCPVFPYERMCRIAQQAAEFFNKPCYVVRREDKLLATTMPTTFEDVVLTRKDP